MRLPRSKLTTKVIVFALVIYAGISLISLRGQIEAAREEAHNLKVTVAETVVENSQLEYNIEHHNEPEVIEELAREMGYVMENDVLISVVGSGPDITD